MNINRCAYCKNFNPSQMGCTAHTEIGPCVPVSQIQNCTLAYEPFHQKLPIFWDAYFSDCLANLGFSKALVVKVTVGNTIPNIYMGFQLHTDFFQPHMAALMLSEAPNKIELPTGEVRTKNNYFAAICGNLSVPVPYGTTFYYVIPAPDDTNANDLPTIVEMTIG